MKKITYVTGNWAKIDSARQILEPLGYTVDNKKIDTIEIQADDVEDVAKYSAKWASNELKCNVLKNDTGLFVEALNGDKNIDLYSAAYTLYDFLISSFNLYLYNFFSTYINREVDTLCEHLDLNARKREGTA